MKDLIRSVKRCRDICTKADDYLEKALVALEQASTQFPIGSTVTMPADFPFAGGTFATIDMRHLRCLPNGSIRWHLRVTFPHTIMEPLWIYKPFVEE